MSIEGYHVSRYEYAPGKVIKIKPGRITHFHTALEQAKNVAAEDRLKPHKPANAPCRMNCIYVFGNLGDCSIYGSSEHKEEKVYYYRVRMEKATQVPMVLVDHIRKQVDPTDAQVGMMAREYWQPSLEWEYWEYLTDAMEILEEVEPLDMNSMEAMTSQCSFGSDGERASKFCVAVMKGHTG
jgi:hypothetical protein